MDHSLQAYLERQSTRQLDAILQYCLAENRWKDYAYIIPEISRIIEEREKDIPYEMTPKLQAAWEKYLKSIEEETPL